MTMIQLIINMIDLAQNCGSNFFLLNHVDIHLCSILTFNYIIMPLSVEHNMLHLSAMCHREHKEVFIDILFNIDNANSLNDMSKLIFNQY